MPRTLALWSALLLAVLIPGTARALGLFLSTQASATLGGLAITDGDVARYDPVLDIATEAFDEGLFSGGEEIDAFHRLDNNHFVISTTGGATLGGLTFEDGDLVEYDPLTDVATLFFDEDLFSANEDIDAFSILASGNYLLSTQGDATLGGLSFEDGDIVEYDPLTDLATLFFDEDLFSGNEDIDALHVKTGGALLLSTRRGATLGGLTFRDGDVVRFDPIAGTATLFFDEDLFSGNEDVNAVFVPQPATGLLVALGLFGLGVGGRARR